MACLGPCPSGKEGEKVTCPKGKSTCPGRPDGFFFEPCIREHLSTNTGRQSERCFGNDIGNFQFVMVMWRDLVCLSVCFIMFVSTYQGK